MKCRHLSRACLVALVSALPNVARAADLPTTAPTASRAGWFPFVIPALGDAQTAASPLNLSFLSPDAAGASGFLRARGEQIVDGRGRVVPLFGTNITDYSVMPPKQSAIPIAARLRELGVNFVRLHYYEWAPAPDGITQNDRQSLDPTKLDQMDWLIYQLKNHGVYVDLNLHIARRYPGLPDSWDWMGKGIDRVHPAFIDSQKQFARDLLTHVNPYTKTAYVNEPGVAAIELNNENTVFSPGGNWADLDAATAAPIVALWNSWLRAKYGNTAGLRAAWDGAIPPDGPELIRNADYARGAQNWDIEANNGAQATAAIVQENGAKLLRWSATRAGSEPWNLQLHQNGVPVENRAPVRLRFRARAAQSQGLQVRLMNSAAPWADVLPPRKIELTTAWQEFDFSGTVDNLSGAPVRLTFDLMNAPGLVELADVSLRVGGKKRVTPDVSLEKSNVPLLADGGDFTDFLAARERETTAEFMRYVREDLGAKSLMWDTQVNYGGARGLLRESLNSDVIDVHEYPDHPRGARQEDGGWIWSVGQKSMLGAAFESLPALAQWRVANRPFVVSEFDLNPPNDHASEAIPLLSLMASYQGWSGFADYAWFNFQPGDLNRDRINSAFGTSGHPGQIALMPAAALLFRLGLIQPATARETLTISGKTLEKGDTNWSALSELWKSRDAHRADGWQTGVAVQIADGATAKKTTLQGAPPSANLESKFASDTGQIRFDRSAPGAQTMTVNAPALRMAFGYTGGKTFDLGDARITVRSGTRENYANLMVVALDGLALSQSKKVLVTAVARVENAGMKYNADRSSVGRDWGAGPTLAEPVKFSIGMPGANWRAFALDGHGQKSGALPMNGAVLQVSQPTSLWYLLER